MGCAHAVFWRYIYKSGIRMEFKKKVLDNGLTIIGEVNEAALSAAVGFFCKTGSRDETDEISGVSHFLEHMMFKGTEKMSALEVNEAFDHLGAKFNAFTSEENTVYYAAVLPEYLQECSSLWAQLMRPSLRDDDFNIEKNVIKEEIAMYKDLPQFDVMDQCRALHFKGHPCGNSVLGTNETIDALTADQMREYFGHRYAPNNMIVACCGNFDFDELCSLVNSTCGKWTPDEAPRAISTCGGSLEKKRQTKDSLVCEHICLLSGAVSMQDPRRYAGSLLSMIVGDQTGSRFFWALVDNALAEVAAMHYETMDGTGCIYSYFRCNPENADKVLQIARDIFAELEKDGINEEELQKSKNKVLSAITIKSEQPMGRLTNLGLNWVYSQKYKSVSDDVEAIKAVTVEDVNALIKDYPLSKFTNFTLGPKA
jgi:predicted Zn-dependent peptidase